MARLSSAEFLVSQITILEIAVSLDFVVMLWIMTLLTVSDKRLREDTFTTSL